MTRTSAIVILAFWGLAVALEATQELHREPLVAISDPLDAEEGESLFERVGVDGLSPLDSDGSAVPFARLVRIARSTTRRKRNNTLTYKKISLKLNTDSSSESVESVAVVPPPSPSPSPTPAGKRRTKPKSSPQTMIYKPSKSKTLASTTSASVAKITILRPGINTEASDRNIVRDSDKSDEPDEKEVQPVRQIVGNFNARPRPWTTTERPEEKRNKPVEQKEVDAVNPLVRPTKRTRIHMRNRLRDQGLDPNKKTHTDIAALRSVQRFRARTSTAAPASRWRTRRPEGSRSHLFPGHRKPEESSPTTVEPTTEHLEAEPSIKQVTKFDDAKDENADSPSPANEAVVRPFRPRIRRPEKRPYKEDDGDQQVEQPKLERPPPIEIPADKQMGTDDEHRKRYEAEKMKQLERLRKHPERTSGQFAATEAPPGNDPSHSAADSHRPHFHTNNPPIADSFPRPEPAERDGFPTGRKVAGPSGNAGSQSPGHPNVYVVHMPPDKDSNGAPFQLDEDTADFTKIFPPPSNFGKRIPNTTPKYKPLKASEHLLASAPLDEQKSAQHSPPTHFPAQPPPNHSPAQPAPANFPTQPPPTHFPAQLPPTHSQTQPPPTHSQTRPPPTHSQTQPPPTNFPAQPPPPKAPSPEHTHAHRDEQKSKASADGTQRYTAKYPSVAELPPGVKLPTRIYTPPEYEYEPPLSYLEPKAPTKHKDYRLIQDHSHHEQHRERPPYPPVHSLPDPRRVPVNTPPRVYEPPWKEYEPPAHPEHYKPVKPEVHHYEQHVEPPPRTYEPPKYEYQPPSNHAHHRPGMHSVPPPRDINDVRSLHPFAAEEWHQHHQPETPYKLLPSSSIQSIRTEENKHPNRHVDDHVKDHVAPIRPEYPAAVAEPYVRVVAVGHTASHAPHPHRPSHPEVPDVLLIPHSEKPMVVTERPYLPERPVVVTERPYHHERPVVVTERPYHHERPVVVTERPHMAEKPIVVTERPIIVSERPHLHDKAYDRPLVVTERPHLPEQHVVIPERPYERPLVVTERPHMPEKVVAYTERPYERPLMAEHAHVPEKTVVDRPMIVTERPHMVDRPVVVTERPFIMAEKPASLPQAEKFMMLPEKTYMVVSEQPLTITERPMTVTERPRTATERPHQLDKYPFIEKPPVDVERPREVHFLVSESEAGRKITPVHIIPPHEVKDLPQGPEKPSGKVPYTLEPDSHKFAHHEQKLEPMVHTRPHNQPRQPETEFMPIPAPAPSSTPPPVQIVHEAVQMSLNQRPGDSRYVQAPPYPAPVTHHVTKPPTNYRHDLQYRPSEFRPHPQYYQVPAPLKSPFTEEESRPPKHKNDHHSHYFPTVHVTNPANRPIHAFPAPAPQPTYQTAATGPIYEIRHYPSSSLVPQHYDAIVSVKNPITYPASQAYSSSSQQFRLPRQEAVVQDQLAIPANLPTSTEELHKFEYPEKNISEPIRLHPPPLTYLPNAEGFRLQDVYPLPVGPPRPQSDDDSAEANDPSNVPVPGQAGIDYPTYYNIPNLNFRCEAPGYFADPSTRCQVFHVCQENRVRDSFLCPNGTIFNQKVRVCDWWHNVNCADAPAYYYVNDVVSLTN